MLNGITYKNKFALVFFIMGKLISFPTAYLIVNGELEKSLTFLYVYSFLIFLSIALTLIPDSVKKTKTLPDGVFYLNDSKITIVNGEITMTENIKCKKD